MTRYYIGNYFLYYRFMSATVYNDADLKQAGYTLLQIDATTIVDALVFLTISSITYLYHVE